MPSVLESTLHYRFAYLKSKGNQRNELEKMLKEDSDLYGAAKEIIRTYKSISAHIKT